jgi:hypothetical protein
MAVISAVGQWCRGVADGGRALQPTPVVADKVIE